MRLVFYKNGCIRRRFVLKMSDKKVASPYVRTFEQQLEQLVAWRRYLHQHPELSFHEHKTAIWIHQQLTKLGILAIEWVGDNGLVVRLHGTRPGPVIAIRADIDALPIQDEKQCEYASRVPGVMHACGHDAHTATLLGIAAYYSSGEGAQFAGERRLLFQPAEEVSPGGAVGLIAAGALSGVDVVYGVHLWTPIEVGQLRSKSGPFMAATDEFEIEVIGRGGHCGLPQQTIDTIVVASAIVQAAQSIVSRGVNPLEAIVVSVGAINAGTTSNVVAERCTLKGTIRSFNEAVREDVKARFVRLVEHTAAAYGAQVRIDMRTGYPAVVNHKAEYQRFLQVASAQVGSDNVIESAGIMAGEDFSYYLREVPGIFMFVGAGNEQIGAVYPHHHPKFDLDEHAMVQSAALLVGLAEHYATEREG